MTLAEERLRERLDQIADSDDEDVAFLANVISVLIDKVDVKLEEIWDHMRDMGR